MDIKQFAATSGYDGYRFRCVYNGADCYEMRSKNGSSAMGYPTFALATANTTRRSTFAETLEIIKLTISSSDDD